MSIQLLSQDFNTDSIEFAKNHIGNRYINDTLYIVATSGLNVRNRPIKTAKIIGKAPFNAPVVYLQDAPESLREDSFIGSIEGRNGGFIWVRLENGIEGYIFSGFTSKAKYPADLEVECGRIVGFTNILGLNLDKPASTVAVNIGKHYGDGKQSHIRIIKTYTDGTTITFSAGYEWTSYTVESYVLSENDIINFLNYFIKLSDEQCNRHKSYKSPEISITEGKEPMKFRKITLKYQNWQIFGAILTPRDKAVITYGTEYGW